MTQKEKTKRSPLIKILCAVIFLILCFVLFIYANFAIGYNGTTQNVGAYEAFDDLEEDTVDVMFIGSSAVSRYFIPSKAYVEEGISSFVLGAQATPIIFTDNIIDYVEKTQSPKLYVIELRNVLDGYDAVNEVDVRKTTDAIDFYKPDRIKMINEAIEVMNKHAEEGTFDDNPINYYFPIIKYHSRLTSSDKDDAITTDDLLLDVPYNKTQGYRCSHNTVTQVPQQVPNYQTKACDLDSDIEEILSNLLDYCDTVDADILFTFSPYIQDKNTSMKTIAVQNYVENRGYTCLNFCSYKMTETLDVDWSTDMYNVNHFNYLGAEKYTSYLEKYLKENYDLKDHRGDESYKAWNKGYEAYNKYVAEGIKYIEDKNQADD